MMHWRKDYEGCFILLRNWSFKHPITFKRTPFAPRIIPAGGKRMCFVPYFRKIS
jgi:hypothetical protein